MIIFKSKNGLHVLQRIHTGKTVNRYKMTINGWYAGGFSTENDNSAIIVFKGIAAAEGVSL